VTIEEAGARVDVSPLPEVEADPVQMRQLVQNLISNAVKFRREGTHPEIYISGETVGDKVTLRIGDNGIGFDERYGERIFGVFKRLHGRDAYPGTGIGLALCRKIAERHGGTITARGVPGEGATFTVTLPASQRGFPPTNGAARASEPAVV
jgi:light-regulated signal transduction histidine kinase (bacteriophytochrome)